MTTDADSVHINRVVVTANLECYLPSAIELAIAIARSNNSGLHGLFIEDLDLLRVADLPFSSEVSLASGQARVLDSQQVTLGFNARSRHFRRSLLRQAEKSSLPWSYSKARGGKLSKALEESINAEFLVIGQSRGALNPSATMRPKCILLLDNHRQRLFQALDVVLGNFTGNFFELLFVPPSSGVSANTVELLSDKLLLHPHSRLVQLSPESLSAVTQTPGAPISCVITSRQRPELMQQVLQHLSCPMIVVS
jgi:hypothetical protein